ncbi:MAG: DUF4124 domain-containing protein [Zoogloeaceae bacterium]|jgi:hypothetical protein|nr:DUF4124 domain-containing protein [Zoogloeaceae bacterium]
MRTRLLLATLLSVALIPGLGQAEIYKWKDAQGRTVISDTPQPGAGKVETLPSATSIFPGASGAEKNKAEPPPSVADQELEFKKRQQERREAAAKAEQEKAEKATNAENCARAQRTLHTLESGARVLTPNEQGGHDYINDQQRQQEIVRARQSVKEWCN